MSHDVLLGTTDRSWSRDLSCGQDSEAPSSAPDHSPLTDKEKERIEKLAYLEMQASNGDAAAQKKMVEVNKAIATLQKRSTRGDAKAKRILSTLQESGLITLAMSQTGPRLVMAGSSPRAKHTSRAAASPAQQVQNFLIALKVKAMAGDPQSIAILRNYQQIVDPPTSAQTASQSTEPQGFQSPHQFNLQAPPSEGPQTYPPRYPTDSQPPLDLAPDGSQPTSAGSFVGFNGHLAFIRGLGEEEIALAREGGASERAALRRRF
jgi:hypothetical protein